MAADIDEDLLLGIDFLTKHGVCVDFGRYEIVWKKQVLRAKVVRDAQADVKICRVRLAENTKVPPNSVAFAVGKLSYEQEGEFVFSPIRSATPCLVPASVHRGGGGMVVFPCVNDTASTMYLRGGLEVGTAMGVDELSQPQGGQKSCSSTAPKVQRTRVQDELPQHLVDLFEKSSEGLDDMQKDSLRTLLIEF